MISSEWLETLSRIFWDLFVRVPVIAGVVAFILFLVRVRSSGVRHAAWTAVLCAMLLMPVLVSWW
jgi:hypothetical protein